MIELFFLLNSGSPTNSMFQIGVFSNRFVVLGVVAMILVQLLFTYAPLMNQVMSSAPTTASVWAALVVVGFISYLAIEVEKAWRRSDSLARVV